MQMPSNPTAASTPLDRLPEQRAMALATDICIHQGSSGAVDLSRRDESEEVPHLEHKESTPLEVDPIQHVCWSSDALVNRTTRAAKGGGGVVVGGRGCSGCVQGEQCSIHVWVLPPAYWFAPLATNQSDGASKGDNSSEGEAGSKRSNSDSSGTNGSSNSSDSSSSYDSSWLKNEFTLTLEGPALGSGDVQCVDPPACSHYLISYRLWDVGEYRATLAVGCANLNFSPDSAAHFNSTSRHDLAKWNLSIGWPEQSDSGNVASASTAGAAGNVARDGAADMGVGGIDAMTPATASSDTTSPSSRATPCTSESIPGCWKKDSSGNYTWTFFPCAPPLSPPSHWISDLRRKGIEEMNIVGDSHQRVLANHLHFLLSGSVGDLMPDARFNHTFHSSNDRKETFRINYYWVDGIYRNGEFGCGGRGMASNRTDSFPEVISRTADVTIMNAGAWTDRFCAHPLQAFRAHLPEFLNWGLQFTAPSGKPLVLRTSTPVPNEGKHCAHYSSVSVGPSTNLGIMELNRLMHHVAAGKSSQSQLSVPSVPVFDGWRIEAPRYLDNCPNGNRHYSCFYAPHFWSGNVAGGVVGEAVVHGLVHFLLHELPFHMVLHSRVPPPPALPLPPASPLSASLALSSDSLRAALHVVSRVLLSLVTHPTAPSPLVSSLVASVADFASSHRFGYPAQLMCGRAYSPSLGGAPAFGMEVLEDRQLVLEFLAAATPHLCTMFLSPEGEQDGLDLTS
ncbi:unnamed protein product [Closterium sp. NIES-54]